MTHHHLDARKLLCPMPVIKLQNLMKQCHPGDTIEVVCTDPGCRHDIPTWCRIHKHLVESSYEKASEYYFSIVVS